MRTPDFEFICEWMRDETGILFRDEDRGFVESRLYDVAADRGMFTVDAGWMSTGVINRLSSSEKSWTRS